MSKIFDRSFLTSNPSNNSPSKQLFSFPKQPRFPKTSVLPLKSPNIPLDSLPSSRPQGRATSMGYGQRTKLGANISLEYPVPGPHEYSHFQELITESKGTKFGRESRVIRPNHDIYSSLLWLDGIWSQSNWSSRSWEVHFAQSPHVQDSWCVRHPQKRQKTQFGRQNQDNARSWVLWSCGWVPKREN